MKATTIAPGRHPCRLPVVAALVGLTIWSGMACTSGPPPPARTGPSHADRVAESRAEKDAVFRSSAQSPIPEAQRATFPGLVYFPADAQYHVPASLAAERSNPPVVIELATSRDTIEQLTKVGTLTFTLGGTRHTLTAFATARAGLNELFVPFGDQTNRQETYGGGRYLNLTRTPTGLYELDFNLAYNPYCVYDVSYVCPLPPAENRLPVRIPAGERMPSS